MALSDFIKPVGKFRDVRVFESSIMGVAHNSAGIALPGYGMIVAPGAYSRACDLSTVHHEYGHFIQARLVGFVPFYLCIGLPSLLSAWTRGFGKGHQNYWTEKWCNYLVNKELDESNLSSRSYPAENLGGRTAWLLGC